MDDPATSSGPTKSASTHSEAPLRPGLPPIRLTPAPSSRQFMMTSCFLTPLPRYTCSVPATCLRYAVGTHTERPGLSAAGVHDGFRTAFGQHPHTAI
jgi:hypothetical protein